MRALGLLVVAAFAGATVLAGPALRDQDGDQPRFLAAALGSSVATAPERRTSEGHQVSLPRSGYTLETAAHRVALSSANPAGTPWRQFERGATRTTPFGAETVVVDGDVVEQFLTVTARTGPKTWRWKFDTGTLKPHLRSDGSVLVSAGNTVAGFRVLPAAILDRGGRDVSPAGTGWRLERRSGSWWLALDVDDAELPLPYVIDPATIALRAGQGANNGGGATTLVITKPAGLAVDDQMVAQVTARGGTGTFICAPAGWTSFRRNNSGTTLAQELFRKTAVAADVAAASFTFTLDNNAGCPSPLALKASGGIVAHYGVDNSSPISASNGQANASSANIAAPTITPGANDVILGAFGTARGTTITAPTGAPTFTELWDQQSTGGTVGTRTTSELATALSPGGATGTKTAVAAAAAVNIGQLASLRLDSTAPTAPALTVSESDPDTHASGTTLYYRPGGNGGTFTVDATSTETGSGIAYIRFPGLTGGFTPTTDTDDTTSLYSHTYSWTAGSTDSGAKTVTATDNATNANTSTFTLTQDSGAPGGGALTVNGVAASGGGSASYDTDGNFTIGTRTDWTDALSGIASSTLTREDGTLAADACAGYGAPSTLVGTPAQNGLATGCYRYTLTGTDNVGNTIAITTVVKVDTSDPAAPGLTLSDSSADVHTSATTAYYRPAGSGAFDVSATSSDPHSGIATYTFPTLTGFTASGSGATRTYTLATPTEPDGAKTVTAQNNAGGTNSSAFTLTADAGAPSGGALTVNGVAASGGGSQSYDTDGSFAIGLRTDWTDALAGIASSTLTREDGALAGDACAGYGAPATLVGTPAQSGLATGCYRYVLTGVDNVGNGIAITTVVKVDTSDPAVPSLTLSDSSADVHTTGTTAYYRPAGAGSFDVTASSSDADSGIGSYGFPALAGFTASGAGGTRTYTLATPTEADGAKTVTAQNNAGGANSSTFTLTADAGAPTGGALTVNGVAASGGGSQSYDVDGSFAIGVRTDWTDAGSGIAGSTLTREDGTLAGDACAGYGAPATLVGTPAQSGLATGCYRYTLTGVDNVGNSIAVTTVVKVDTSDPTAPSLTLTDSSGDVHTTGTTAFYRPAGAGAFDVTASSSDAHSGIASYGFPALAGFATSGAGASRTYTLATPTEADGAKSVTVQNNAGGSNSSTFTLTADSGAPGGGALTVNGVAASGGGSASYDTDGNFTIGTRTDWTDALSGIASSTLTREDGTLAADACAGYGAPSTLVGTPAQNGLATGCYRYVLTGVDNVGNNVAITTVVKVDTSDPAAPSLTLSDSSADVHTTGTTAYYRPAGTGSFDVSASSSDAHSGIATYTFPTLTGFTTSGAGASRTYTLATPTEPDGAKNVTVQNNAGGTNSSTFTLTADSAAPTGGSVTANGGAAYDADGTVAVAKVDYSDGGAGVGSQTLTRSTATLANDSCGGFAGTDPVTLSGGNDADSLSTGCYRYTLTATDNVGNQASVQSTIVKVDLTAPGAPSLTLSDSSADVHTTGTTAFYRPAGAGSFDVTASAADADTGVLDYGFPTLAGFTTSGSGGTRTYTLNTPTEPDGAKPVTARNPALLSSGVTTFTLTADAGAPTGGALTVNGVAASGGGSQSYDADGSFTIGTRTDWTDAGSGIASSTLTREDGTLAGDACAGYGAPTTLVGTPAQSGLADGCYRYTLTGTDNVGNSAAVTTVVKVDSAAPSSSVDPASPYSTTAVSLTYSASDGGSGLAEVELWAKGPSDGSYALVATDSSPATPSFSYTASQGDGIYLFYTRARDAAGNTEGVPGSPPDTQTSVDQAKPTSAATALATYQSSETFAIAYSSSDAVSGVDEVELWARGPADGAYALVATDTTPASPSFSYTAGQGDGLYRFYTRARDAAGNVEDAPGSPDAQTTLETTAPSNPALSFGTFTNASATGTTVYIREGVAGGFTVGSDASDPESGVADHLFPSLGGTWTGGGTVAGDPAAMAYTFTATDTAPGGAHLVTATNGAGLSAGTTFTVNADAAAPSTTATCDGAACSAGWYTTSPVSVALSASDAGAGVDQIRYTTDGTDPTILTGSVYLSAIDVAGEGTTTVKFRAFDRVGNAEPVQSVQVRIDTIDPQTTIDSGPSGSLSNTSAEFTFSSNEGGSFECRLDGGAFTACSTPKSYSGLVDGSHTFEVRAIDPALNADSTPASRTWTVDTVAADTTITIAPPASTNATGASFSFTASDAGPTFECRLDGGAFSDCLSPKSYAGLSEAAHTFEVRAEDAAGNVDPTPASHTWTVDLTAPDTSFLSTPSNPSSNTTPSFGLGSTESPSTFECDLDGAGWASCPTPYTTPALGDGSHTLDVRATDAAGNTDGSHVTYTWLVDATPPTGSITSPANGADLSGTVVLTGNSADAGGSGVATVVFQRSPAGGGTWTNQAATWDTTLQADGDYDLRVVTTDNAGNSFTSPAITVTVDNTAPTLSVSVPNPVNLATPDPAPVSAIAGDTGTGIASVEFEQCNESSATCTSDTWTSFGVDTTSPYDASWAIPAEGTRLIRVRATDNAGRATTELVLVTIDRTRPTGALTAPAAGANLRGASVALAANASDAAPGTVNTVSFQRSPAGAGTWTDVSTDPAAPYTATLDTTGLADGLYDLRVFTTDAAGNAEVAPATIPVRVDNTLPTGSVTSPAAAANLRGTIALTSDSSDGGSGVASVQFQRSPAGAGTWTNQAASFDTTLVADGQYDLRVVTTDNAGNAFTSAAITVRVDNTLPTGAVTSPAAAANVRGTITLTSDSADTPVNGSASGVAIVQFQRSPAAAGIWLNQAAGFDTTTVPDGQYDLRVVTTDNAGNSFTSSVITVRVDNTLPTGNLTAPADGAEIGVPPVSLTSDSADSGSGVSSVVFERRVAGSGGAWTPTASSWNTAGGPDAVADGSYELRVTTTDNAGNAFSSAFVTVLVDHTATVTSASLAPGSPSNAPVTVSFTAGDGAGSGVSATSYSVDGGTVQQGAAVVIGAPGDHSNDGSHVVQFFSTDQVGNVEAPQTVTVVIDTTAPSGSAGDPGDYLRGIANLTYSTAATDVSSVQFQFSPAGAGSWSNIAGADLTPPYEASWNTVLVADGPYDLRAVVTDSTGNVANELLPGLPKTVDNTAPSGSVTSPAASAYVSGLLDVDATATDGAVPPASGVSAVRFEVKPFGAGTFTVFGTQTVPVVGSTYRQALATGSLADGQAELRVVVTDVAGNETTSATHIVNVDNLAPTVTLNDPGPAISGTVTLGVVTSADTAQVVFERTLAGAGSWTTIDTDVTPGDGFTADLAAGALPDGLYDLRARATDAGGNSTTSATRTTRIDNTLPTGAITTPSVGATVGGPAVQLAASAADSGSGVTTVTFEVKTFGSGSFAAVGTDTTSPYQLTWDATTAPDGATEIRAVVTDAAGNTRQTAIVPVTVDSTGPSVTLDDPGAVVSGTVALSASTGGGAARVAFGVSPAGAGTWTEIASDTSAPFGTTFDTATLADGNYDLRAIGYDALGNASAPFVRANVRFDNVAPSLVSSTPGDGSVSTSANQIVLTANEPVTAAGAELDGAPAPAPTVSGATLTFATGALSDGLHVLDGELVDAGGMRTPFRVAVTIESTPSADPPPVERSITSSGDWTMTIPGGLVTVKMPQSAWPTPPTPQDYILVLRVDAGPNTAGFADGTRIVEVTARWAIAGTYVTEFREPLEIIFSNPTGAPVVPSWSANGTSSWNTMGLVEGPTLPAARRDGFYRDAAGVHALTRHLTFFGLVVDDEAPTAPRHIAGVVIDGDGLTIRWIPGTDSSGQLGPVLLSVNGSDYRYFGPTEYEAKMGPFSPGDTRTFTLVQLDAAGNRSAQTPPLRAVPPLAGRGLEQASAALIAAGFSVGDVREETSALHAPGTVIAPANLRLAVASTAIDLVVARAPGTKPQTRLVFSVAGAKKLALKKPTTIAVRVKVSRPANVEATLFGTKQQRLYTWRVKIKAGATVVKLRLPAQIRRPGTYKLSFVARSGTETIRRSINVKLVGPKLADAKTQEIEVVLTGDRTAQGVRVLARATPDQTFALAASASRNVGIVVADVDAYGVVFVGDLHTVFPALQLIAIAREPATRARAIRAGAVLALPRNTSPHELGKAIVRIAGR